MATTLCEQSRFRIIFNAVALYIWRAATQPFIDGVLSQRQRECILKPRAHALAVLSRPFFRAAVLYSSAPVTTWSTSFFGLFHMDSSIFLQDAGSIRHFGRTSFASLSGQLIALWARRFHHAAVVPAHYCECVTCCRHLMLLLRFSSRYDVFSEAPRSKNSIRIGGICKHQDSSCRRLDIRSCSGWLHLLASPPAWILERVHRSIHSPACAANSLHDASRFCHLHFPGR